MGIQYKPCTYSHDKNSLHDDAEVEKVCEATKQLHRKPFCPEGEKAEERENAD